MFAPFSSRQRENWTLGSTQETHPKVVVPLGCGSGRGDRWQRGHWGHPPVTPSICQRETASNVEQKRTEEPSETKPGDSVNWGLEAAARGPQLGFSKGSGHLPPPSRQPSRWEHLHALLRCWHQWPHKICSLHPQKKKRFLSKPESALPPSLGQGLQQQLTNNHSLNYAAGCHFLTSVVINKFKI